MRYDYSDNNLSLIEKIMLIPAFVIIGMMFLVGMALIV